LAGSVKKAFTYLGISMALSFVFAVTYVIVMTLTLPKSDLAHGQAPFADSLVFPIMSMIAGISGLVAWPLFAMLGRRAPPAAVAKIAGISTVVFIVVVTPFQSGIGWLGSYAVCLGALIYCSVRYGKDNGQQSAGGNAAAPRASA
jgi:uncharacterized BrkB/YihY/UPF0761 family membrane protein